MNKAKYINVDEVMQQLILRKYEPEYVRKVLHSINEIGVNATAIKFNISKTTLRWWRNPGRNAAYMLKYQDKEKDKLAKRERYKTHYDKVIEQHKRYQLKRYHSDPNFRLRALIRSRVWRAIKDQKGEKLLKLTEYLGCDINTLRKHFESKFAAGMTWDNYGEWHIDHVKPCASFDLTKLEEQQACFHYTNLQPLWAEDNLRKSDK